MKLKIAAKITMISILAYILGASCNKETTPAKDIGLSYEALPQDMLLSEATPEPDATIIDATTIDAALPDTAIDISPDLPLPDLTFDMPLPDVFVDSGPSPDMGTTCAVMPPNTFNSTGPFGGPFSTEVMTFVLLNNTAQASSFIISSSETWVMVVPPSGAIPAGASFAVTVILNPTTVYTFSPGTYTARVTITGSICNDDIIVTLVVT